jgi:DNA-binding transcriptional LysR family regulator
MVAVGAGHRLAGRDTVDVAELEHEAWIVAGGEGPQFDVWPSVPGEARVAYAVRDWPGRLGLVGAGLGVAIVPEMIAAAMPPGVELISVDEPNPVRRAMLAVTRPDRSPGAAAVVDALRAAGASLSR